MGKIRTTKTDESTHPAEILTKPLQGSKFVFKRARILGLEGAAPPPPKCQPAGSTPSRCDSGAWGDPRRDCRPRTAADDAHRGGAPRHDMSNWRAGPPHGGAAEGSAGPRRMSEASGATRCRGRV